MCLEGVYVYLGGEVVLLQLPPLSQVPAADRVVQPPRPQLGPVVGDVDTAGPVSVALELPGGGREGGGGHSVRPRTPNNNNTLVISLSSLPPYLTRVWL